jgi:DNA-binding NarL/FixJ family response regulator
MSICILIADDHAVVRQGLKMFLETDSDLRVVGEAENGEDTVQLVGELQPDIVLMDLIMPGMDGISATSRIRRQYPDVEVIALTSVLDDGSIFGAIRAGAIGYLLKDTKADRLISAVKSAVAGQVQLSPQVAERLMREIDLPDVIEPLTERETDVLRMLALGCSNKEIARDLNIGEKTVKTHVSSILSKLGVTSRTQAVIYALRTGLIMFPPNQS